MTSLPAPVLLTVVANGPAGGMRALVSLRLPVGAPHRCGLSRSRRAAPSLCFEARCDAALLSGSTARLVRVTTTVRGCCERSRSKPGLPPLEERCRDIRAAGRAPTRLSWLVSCYAQHAPPRSSCWSIEPMRCIRRTCLRPFEPDAFSRMQIAAALHRGPTLGFF